MTYNRNALTLGQLLGSDDLTIRRNAMSILKVLTGCDHKIEDGQCIYCFKPFTTSCPDCWQNENDCRCIK